MNCPNCGAPADGGKFCAHCGTPISQPAPQPQQQNYQQPTYQPNQYNQPYQPNQPNQYNQPYQPNQYNQPYQQPVVPDKYNGHKMGWYKFLIYFSLFAGAVINIINGISTISGSQYGGQADRVYTVLNGMKIVDVTYGILLIGIAALAIVARFQLAGLKRKGPALLYAYSISGMVATVVYLVLVGVIISRYGVNFGSIFDARIIGSILGSIIFLVINIIYFNKRRDIFVN